MLPHGETVTVHRPGGVDRWGQRLPGTRHTISGCGFGPSRGPGRASSEEVTEQANRVVTGLIMYAAHGADVGALDVVERADGTRWHVLGDPDRWSSPLTGWAAGVEVALERVTG